MQVKRGTTINKPETTAMVIIAKWLSDSHTKFTANDTPFAVADDLLHCDWLGRDRLIITLEVCHLAIVTLGIIHSHTLKLSDCQVRYTHPFNDPFFRDYPGQPVPER